MLLFSFFFNLRNSATNFQNYKNNLKLENVKCFQSFKKSIQ